MQSKQYYWPGIIPVVIILFFPLNHYQDMVDIPLFRTFFTILFITFIIFIIIATTYKNKYTINVIYSLKNVYIYILFLGVILIIASIFSVNFYYSATRSILAVIMLCSLISVFYFIQYFYIKNIKWRNFWEVSSLIFLVTLILGQVFIDEWLWKEIRFSGGINPNRTGFYILFFLFQTHINALLDGKWTKLRRTVWFLSLIIIIWTFSRTALLTVLIAYLLYFVYIFIVKLSISGKVKVNYSITMKKSIKWFVYIILFSVTLKLISNYELYFLIIDRLFNVETMTSREETWNIVMNTFQENPFFGEYGWWGSKETLVQIAGVADSSHNFFIRMLSEVGLLGLIAIVFLPLTIIFLLLLNNNEINQYFKSHVGFYLVSVLFSMFFIAQFFEDRYLTMFFANTSDIIIWFISFSLIIYQIGTKKIK